MKKKQLQRQRQMILGLLMFVVLCVASSLGQSVDGGTVRNQCEKALKSGSPDSTCAGYMRGLLDANNVWFAAMLKEKHLEVLTKFYCAPDDITAKDAARVYVDWIKHHPEYESQSAANAFVFAMREKYSCK